MPAPITCNSDFRHYLTMDDRAAFNRLCWAKGPEVFHLIRETLADRKDAPIRSCPATPCGISKPAASGRGEHTRSEFGRAVGCQLSQSSTAFSRITGFPEEEVQREGRDRLFETRSAVRMPTTHDEHWTGY